MNGRFTSNRLSATTTKTTTISPGVGWALADVCEASMLVSLEFSWVADVVIVVVVLVVVAVVVVVVGKVR